MVSMNVVTSCPSIVDYWDDQKNPDVNLNILTSGSNVRVVLTCKKGHEFVSAICDITRKKSNELCPYCSGKKLLVGFNDLATLKPELVKEWDCSSNQVSSSQILAGSGTKVFWVCSKGHQWKASVANRVNHQSNCPYCSGRMTWVGFNDLLTTYPLVAAEWDFVKNSKLVPTDVTAGSNKKVWWKCAFGHSWCTTVCSRCEKRRGTGCPYCNGRNFISGVNDLVTMNSQLVKEWHPTLNGKLLPSSFSYGSGKKVWWLGVCEHEWEAAINNRSISHVGCPYCNNRKVLLGFNDLVTTRPELAKQWHSTKNGELNPVDVTYGSTSKVWWQCDKGHEWEASVYSRGWISSSVGCPSCAYVKGGSKGENELADFVKQLGFVVERSTRKIISPFELDVYIPEKRVAIEFNGVYWHSEKYKGETYHYDKWKVCKGQGIQLMQIWEDDWNRNPELIKRMIAHKLGVSDEEKVFARNTRVIKISNVNAKKFLNLNHLQGSKGNARYFGLQHNTVIVAVVGITRKPGNILEIARFATSIQVVGGFSKLLKNVLNEVKYKNIQKVLSYSHNDYATGNVYEKTGFVKVHDGKPGYSYVVNNTRVNRLNFIKKRFADNPNLLFEEGLTERELAELNGLVRVWDSGSSLWVKVVKR